MHVLPPALSALAAFPQFITYRLVPSSKPGKMDKLPLDWRTGRMPPRGSGGHISPDYRTTFADAAKAIAEGKGDGVGYVFTAEDPFWFLDIDGALQPDGQWSELARTLCERFAGAAVEVSQSGRGLHIIGSGTVPPHGCKNIPLGLEFYSEDRFVALTGTGATGDAAADFSAYLPTFLGHMFPANAPAVAGSPDEWTTAPVPEWSGPTDDGDLIRRAMASGARSAAAAFGGDDAKAVTFADLWEGNVEALAARWPSDTGKDYDGSSADASLAAHLAYWTGKDCERIRNLMYQSALYRDKWDARSDYYLPRTILRACGVSSEVAKGSSDPLPPVVTAAQADAAKVVLRTGTGYMGADAQLVYFADCVYVQSENRVFIPSGALLNKSQFNATFGGYDFVLDAQAQKMTDSAWDAFLQNRVYEPPKCDRMCFRPELGARGIVEKEGQKLLNTYVPVDTARKAGDASKFEGFVAKILPDPRDRQILLSYMAALVRFPGRKFQWWPVLQGTQGNGKSLLLRVLAHSVGERYTHLVDVHKMAKVGSNFNAWIQGNLFVGIEEIYVAERRDFLESFKATVTNDRLPLEKKGVDQSTGDNRVNGLMLTNHEDGVPINPDDRRYAIFYTAQQSAADVEADGMGGVYFPDLYDWLKGENAYAAEGPSHGYAIVNEYLRNYAIAEEFNPAGICTRAPQTSSTSAAIIASRGRAEQEVIEAVEQGQPGFNGGWISSVMLDRLLERIRINIPRAKRRAMLESLGYVAHPGLASGRTTITVQPDSARPRLYIRAGHVLQNLDDPLQISKRYERDQTPGTAADAAANFGT